MISRILFCLAFLSSFAWSQQVSPVILWQNPSSVPHDTPLSSAQLDAAVVAGPIVPVSLSNYYNVTGITTAGFPFTQGFDAGSAAYPDSALSGTLTWHGVTFPIGPADAPDAVTMMQNIALPAGKFGSLLMLANAVNNPPMPQTFTVTYTDGTTAAIPLFISDWGLSSNYTDESTAICTPYRYAPSGAKNTLSVCLRGYSLPLDSTRTVSSISMPLIRDLVVVSMAVAPPAVAGTFAYTPASGTVLADGSYMLRADFTPADATTYSSVSAVVPFTVALPVPLYPAAITWPQPAAINYGTPLSSVQLNATGTNTPPSIQVPLLDYYRLDTVFNDGQCSGTEGLNGIGYSFSAQALGPAVGPSRGVGVFFAGTSYELGPPNVPSGVTSVTVPLPPGNFSTLSMLGASGKGAQINQPFTVTYSDGSTDVKLVSMSDWTSPQSFAGETIVKATTVWDTGTGVQLPGRVADLYGYQLALTNAKTVASLTLPANANVVVMAIGLGNGSPSPAPGSFTYNPPSGTVLNPGLQPLSATFTPIDTVNYAVVPVKNQIQVIGSYNFTLTSSTNSLLIRPGALGQLVVHVSPTLLNTYPGAVTFSLVGSLPPHTVATFTPSNVAVDAGPADATMVLDLTQVASNAEPMDFFRSQGSRVMVCAGLFLLLPWAGIRKFRRGSAGWSMFGRLAGLTALFALLAGSTGCTTIYRGATYQLTIHATAGGIDHSVPLTLQIDISK